MQFTVNETKDGIVTPPKDICKVQGCTKGRFKRRGGVSVFCKPHSGLRTQISKKKFKDLAGNNELVIAEPKSKKKGITSNKKKMRALRKAILAV